MNNTNLSEIISELEEIVDILEIASLLTEARISRLLPIVNSRLPGLQKKLGCLLLNLSMSNDAYL